nr:type IV secretory system conjugative DNA transfer family protein [Bradyrhizobium sp. 21]
MLNWSGSVVVLDVKKENWDRSAGFRATHGQEIYLFDPLRREWSNRALQSPGLCAQRSRRPL